MVMKAALGAAVLALPIALATPASAAESAQIELESLNDSGASGTATLVQDEEAGTLTVRIRSTGLTPELPHAQHIHIGGNNVCPTPQAQFAGDDDIVSTVEGQPAYGEIQVSLTTTGAFGPDSALAVERFPVADADGAVSYERTFDLSEVDGAIALEDVVIVQHGIDTISPNGQYGPPPPVSELDPALPLEATAPATCGSVQGVEAAQVDAMPSGGVQAGGGGTAGLEREGLLLLGGAGLLAAGALTLRRRVAVDR